MKIDRKKLPVHFLGKGLLVRLPHAQFLLILSSLCSVLPRTGKSNLEISVEVCRMMQEKAGYRAK